MKTRFTKDALVEIITVQDILNFDFEQTQEELTQQTSTPSTESKQNNAEVLKELKFEFSYQKIIAQEIEKGTIQKTVHLLRDTEFPLCSEAIQNDIQRLNALKANANSQQTSVIEKNINHLEMVITTLKAAMDGNARAKYRRRTHRHVKKEKEYTKEELILQWARSGEADLQIKREQENAEKERIKHEEEMNKLKIFQLQQEENAKKAQEQQARRNQERTSQSPEELKRMKEEQAAADAEKAKMLDEMRKLEQEAKRKEAEAKEKIALQAEQAKQNKLAAMDEEEKAEYLKNEKQLTERPGKITIYNEPSLKIDYSSIFSMINVGSTNIPEEIANEKNLPGYNKITLFVWAWFLKDIFNSTRDLLHEPLTQKEQDSIGKYLTEIICLDEAKDKADARRRDISWYPFRGQYYSQTTRQNIRMTPQFLYSLIHGENTPEAQQRFNAYAAKLQDYLSLSKRANTIRRLKEMGFDQPFQNKLSSVSSLTSTASVQNALTETKAVVNHVTENAAQVTTSALAASASSISSSSSPSVSSVTSSMPLSSSTAASVSNASTTASTTSASSTAVESKLTSSESSQVEALYSLKEKPQSSLYVPLTEQPNPVLFEGFDRHRKPRRGKQQS